MSFRVLGFWESAKEPSCSHYSITTHLNLVPSALFTTMYHQYTSCYILSHPQAILAGAKEQSKAESESVESGGPCVTEADIASIVAQWTGIPIEKVRAVMINDYHIHVVITICVC